MVARRGLAREALDDDIGPQPAQHLDEEVDVLPDLPETEPTGVGIVLVGHGRTAEDLQLVEFHRGERQRVDGVDLAEQHLVALARQAEDEVGPHVQPPPGGELHGAAGAGEVMTPSDGAQRRVRGRLDTVLDGHVAVARHLGQQVELRLVDAVGTRSHDDALDLRMGERLVVERPQPLGRRIGVRVGLEVDQIAPRRAVAVHMEGNPLLDLLRDALLGPAIRRGERSVVTERTPPVSQGSVAIGAGEARIDG